jgi:ubiquinone/menaquinone biosynthesis C-methylase UbiE
MNVQQAYDQWSQQYDINENKTRDLEAKALREVLSTITFQNCLEVGCGTGKNTQWLITKAKQITAVDLSAEMLQKAKKKIANDDVSFIQADITKEWNFTTQQYDLVRFSLVLEHIENLEEVFRKAWDKLNSGGYVYVGELHPFKQYSGSKARFETEEGLQVVTCFNHHVSDFTQAAKNFGFNVINLQEYFDDSDRTNIPRLLTILFQKA